MDITALSIGFSQMNLHQQASISVMKMAMEQAINPHLGGNIDIAW